MTENKRTVEMYMDGFRKSDHAQFLSCLTDDVEWDMPGAFHLKGFVMQSTKIKHLTTYLMELK